MLLIQVMLSEAFPHSPTLIDGVVGSDMCKGGQRAHPPLLPVIRGKWALLSVIRGKWVIRSHLALVIRLRSEKLKNLGTPKEDIWSVPQCIMLLCYSGSTSHNAQCFYDDQDQFSQFSPHCRIHAHSSIILKDTVWIAEFSWFSSLFGIFKALLSLENLNR